MSGDLRFIGRNIRFFRRQRGWTIAELARQATVGEVPLGRMERGENAPSAAALYRLSRALGVSVEMLFSETDQARLMRQVEETGDPFICTLNNSGGPPLPRKIRIMAADLINAFSSLEDICRAPKHARVPLLIPFSPEPAGMEVLARDARRYMGIENGVVFDYFELFENTGLRVLVVPMAKTTESFSYFDRRNQNAFFFLNSRLNSERQLFKLIYEFGRVLILTAALQQGGDPFPAETAAGQTEPESPHHDPGKPFTAHRAARRFAACFLMPAPAVRETVAQLGISPGQWSYELLLRLKHRFGISAQTFLYRLEELALIKQELKDDFDRRIKAFYQESDFCEPDCSRRLLTPNGRLWDLAAAARQAAPGNPEIEEIVAVMTQYEVPKI
ncbi:MAG: ImmA/IrrE family metallo-endopeptidase [Thermodesulfobacteriota bacterium]